VVLGGLMSGVLYSLVAIGLVLIFKASGVFNFAQGAMVLFAALSLVRLMEKMPSWWRSRSPSRSWWRWRG
jgi:branched-chain amino acid transport system permease protein